MPTRLRRLRLLAVPSLLLLMGCMGGLPCFKVGEEKCGDGVALRCSSGDGWSLTNYWSRTECHTGEICQEVGEGAFCGVEPFEQCPEYGATRCVDARLQECSGPLGPDTPQFWRARDQTCSEGTAPTRRGG